MPAGGRLWPSDDDGGLGRDTQSGEQGEHPVLIFMLILGIFTMFGDFTRSFVLSFLRQKNVFVLMFTLFVYLGGGGDSLFVVDFPFYLSSKDHQDNDIYIMMQCVSVCNEK